MPEPTVNPTPRPGQPSPTPSTPAKPAAPAPTKPAVGGGSMEDIFKASGGNLEAARAKLAEYKGTFNGNIPDQIYSNWVDEFFPGRAFAIALAKQWSK